MNRLIVFGDSNVYRHTTGERLALKLGRPVVLQNATRQITLESQLRDSVRMECDVVVISAFSNILTEIGRGVIEEELEVELMKGIEDLVCFIATETVNRRVVALVPPLFRDEPSWFGPHLTLMHDVLVRESGLHPNMTVLPIYKLTGVDLQEDKIHLIPSVGLKFIDFLVSCVLDLDSSPAFAKAGSSGSGTTLSLSSPDPTTGEIMNLLNTTLIPKLDELTGFKNRVDRMEQKMLQRLNQYDIDKATDREEIDNLKNDHWRDRVVVIGLKTVDYPEAIRDRKTHISALLRNFIESITGELVYDVYPKNKGLVDGVIPAFDLRFPSVTKCTEFKHSAFKKLKEADYATTFDGVSFVPKVTPGTRVRIEVLRAISKKLTHPEEGGYCPIYNDRPILQIGPIVDNKVQFQRTLTYVESVLRYRHLVTISDLNYAYKRVGTGYNNCLCQTFLVLNDEDRTTPSVTPTGLVQQPSGRGRGMKRKYEGGRGRGGRGFPKRSK